MHSPRKVLSCAEFRSEFASNESKRLPKADPMPPRQGAWLRLIAAPQISVRSQSHFSTTGNIINVICCGYE
jgi:hypothetical protein